LAHGMLAPVSGERPGDFDPAIWIRPPIFDAGR
jgi:hypothetical protein